MKILLFRNVWKNNKKFISKPCEKLKEILKNNNINFIEEFKPLNNKSYSIDIFIQNKEIGLEINGNQHYNSDKTLMEYYQKRNDEIESVGIKLINIHYSKIYNLDFINELILFLKNT